MGQMRFRVPEANRFDDRQWNTAVVTGIEGIPWVGRVRLKEGILELERTIDESGKLSLIWPTREFGPITLTTSSLRCGDELYSLPVELARGTLHRIRGRALDWQRLGLKLPDAFCKSAEAALDAFLDCISVHRHDPNIHHHAQRAIEHALAASRPLTSSFVQQSIQARHQQEAKLSTLLGVKLDAHARWREPAELSLPAMSMACIGLEWGKIEAHSGRVDYDLFDDQIEWARSNNLRVCGGPLIGLQSYAMPQWLYLLDDFDTFLDAACAFARKTVLRYKGKVHLWSAAAGLNSPNELGLTDEQILRLAVSVIQTVRRADDRTPVILQLDLPWAEYLGQHENAVSPIHLADALIRADLGLAGICLDFNMNTSPGGSLPRDLIDLADLIDHWSLLGLPLIASLQVPFDGKKDQQANGKVGLISDWKQDYLADIPKSDTATGMPPSAVEMIQLLLSKPNVHAILWSQASDIGPHYFPNAGFFDCQGNRRSCLDALIQLRRQHVQ